MDARCDRAMATPTISTFVVLHLWVKMEVCTSLGQTRPGCRMADRKKGGGVLLDRSSRRVLQTLIGRSKLR